MGGRWGRALGGCSCETGWAPPATALALARSPARAQVSLSAFAYLFSELVQYCQARVSNVGELERRQARARERRGPARASRRG